MTRLVHLAAALALACAVACSRAPAPDDGAGAPVVFGVAPDATADWFRVHAVVLAPALEVAPRKVDGRPAGWSVLVSYPVTNTGAATTPQRFRVVSTGDPASDLDRLDWRAHWLLLQLRPGRRPVYELVGFVPAGRSGAASYFEQRPALRYGSFPWLRGPTGEAPAAGP